VRIVVIQAMAAEGADENSEAGIFCRYYADMAYRNMSLVKDTDTELVFRFPKWGLTGLDAFLHTSYLHRLNDCEQFHLFLQAEKDGFDAAISGCYYDPMLKEIRQAVNIPVIGIAQSSILVTALMGARFGMVVAGAASLYEYEENIAKYGFANRCVGLRPIPQTAEELTAALTNVKPTIEVFKTVARELIREGADVIIPGCGLLSPALRMVPGAEEEYPHGLTEVDGVAVVDVLGIAVKMAEMLVSLKRGGASWISKSGLYAPATKKALENGEMVMRYQGLGTWDVEF